MVQQKVMSAKSARRRMMTLILPCLVYALMMLILALSLKILLSSAEFHRAGLFRGIPLSSLIYGGSIVFVLFSTLVPFTLTALILKQGKRKSIKPTWVSYLGLTCIALTGYLLISSVFSFVTSLLGGKGLSWFYVDHELALTLADQIMYFVLFVLVLPICEEYAFRGVVFRGLSHFGVRFGILAASLLASICDNNLYQAFPTFALSVYLCIVAVRYQSIKPTIFIHVGLHLFFYLLEMMPAQAYQIVIILSVLIFVGALMYYLGHGKNRRLVFAKNSGESYIWRLWLKSWALIVLVILFILQNYVHYFL